MPPKKAAVAQAPSASRTLIRTGPKEVEVSKRSKKERNAELPSTTKALVLRNGKTGTQGTGEVFKFSGLTGRDKLDLLAEDIIEKSKTAVGTPFRLKESQKIAESQLCDYIDDVTNLQDPDLFGALIEEEIKARIRPSTDKNAPDQARNPTFIAQVVADRIHNTFLLTSAWRIAADLLIELEQDGVTDGNVATRLREDEDIRARYVVLYKLVSRLVDLGQTKFSVLATTTPHFAKYFKRVEQEQGEADYIFDWTDLKGAARSFIDSIIIELCFPRAPYPRTVLYQILRDAVAEAPKEAKRFPQALWNSVGDLAFCVELQKILEAPLLGPEGQAWLTAATEQMPRQVENWFDAQILSAKAAEKSASFKDLIYPLSKTRSPAVLQNMWKYVNLNYKSVSGHESAASLWQLEDALLHPTPKWSYIRLKDSDFLKDEDGPARLEGGKKKPLLAITSGQDSDTDDAMPDLQDVSDSSDDNYTNSDDEESDYDFDSESDDTGYDTDEEDEMRELLREAMDTATGGDWFHSEGQSQEDDPFKQEERKGNPFLKLLGSLRGRMFNSSSKLKTTPAGYKPDPSRIPKMPTTKAKTKAKPTTPGAPGSLKTTIEEAEDEDDVAAQKKKKKKKPKKKKKKSAAAAAGAAGEAGESDDEDEVQAETASPQPPVTTPAVAAAPPSSPAPKKPAPPKPKAPSIAPSASTISLPIGETTAQSARSYLAEKAAEGEGKQKEKVKTRSAFSGILAKLGMGSSADKDKPKETPKEIKATRRNWFSHLNKKTKTSLHQLLNTSEDTSRGSTGMKWDTFVKLMKDMGFTMDESTAGSSVRFDPPGAEDRSISFHKPHPDTTIDRIKLKEWSKKLQRYYGWKPEDVMAN